MEGIKGGRGRGKEKEGKGRARRKGEGKGEEGWFDPPLSNTFRCPWMMPPLIAAYYSFIYT